MYYNVNHPTPSRRHYHLCKVNHRSEYHHLIIIAFLAGVITTLAIIKSI
jgi:hypothetical protein